MPKGGVIGVKLINVVLPVLSPWQRDAKTRLSCQGTGFDYEWSKLLKQPQSLLMSYSPRHGAQFCNKVQLVSFHRAPFERHNVANPRFE